MSFGLPGTLTILGPRKPRARVKISCLSDLCLQHYNNNIPCFIWVLIVVSSIISDRANTIVGYIHNYKYLSIQYKCHVNYVTVHMKAVKFVCNGANIMRPGNTTFQFFEKDSIVVIKDADTGKTLSTSSVRCIITKSI